MNERTFTFALAGNPNAGKTTIFNNLTGTRQKVGNWPGVTVEKKEGTVLRNGYQLKIVDLPGTYSLTPFSTEEIIARNFILESSPDVVIAIIDASNLERSLYLATQLRELDCKVVFALNMADMARDRGIKIDAAKLSELLDVPVVFTVGNKNRGMDELLETAIHAAQVPAPSERKRKVRYNPELEKAIAEVEEILLDEAKGLLPYPSRWAAVKLIEDDTIVKERLISLVGDRSNSVLDVVERQRRHIRNRFNEDAEIIATDERYGFISGIVKEVHTSSTLRRVDISRSVDLILTNRFLGMPIFFFFIWAMFQLTFTLGEYPKTWIDDGVGWLVTGLQTLFPDGLVKDLLLDGIVKGVGTVIVFLPNILILFFCISIFEDTGYMARAAFLMDKVMHLVGLHGKSFIPMLMGFGCNVPAIMASRTLESKTDRLLTILITPFMSCSAKLPVYIVLAGAFFGTKAGSVIFAIYMAGILLSILTGRLFRSTLFKGADAPFVMELPPYRVPMLKSLLIHMWDRSKQFLKRMGGVILVGSMVIWALASFPRDDAGATHYLESKAAVESRYAGAETDSEAERLRDEALAALEREKQAWQAEYSLLGRIGQAIAPLFKPIGVDWRGGIALLSGFVAKEIVVSTLGVLHAVTESEAADALGTALRASGMTALSALSMMVFVLLYLPCLATVAAIRRETGSAKWMWFSIFYTTTIAWVMAFVVYQSGLLLGFK